MESRLVTCRYHCGTVKDANEATGVAQLVGAGTDGWALYRITWDSGCYGYTSYPPEHLTKTPMEYQPNENRQN